MSDELLDIVDRDGKVIGTATRKECHNNPKIIHRVAHCWIFNNQGQVLWQQRSLLKDMSPGFWDMSCGGHVPNGEEPNETLKRELEEELGITGVNPILVDKYIWSNEKQTELVYLYYLVLNKKIEDFKLQKEEVEKVQWINIWKAQEQTAEGKVKATHWIFSQVSRIFQHVFVEAVIQRKLPEA